MNKEEGVPVAKPPEAAALSNVCLLMPKKIWPGQRPDQTHEPSAMRAD